MCKYSYSNGRCANIDIDDFFCVGESNCSISIIMRNQNDRENVPIEKDINDLLELFPVKTWTLKSSNKKKKDTF